jgi:alkylation response protein AidB-like acyl-CoA dehydrogenase
VPGPRVCRNRRALTPSADPESPSVEAARTLRPRILAGRERGHAERPISAEFATDLARAGLLRLFRPAAYGGPDLTPAEGTAALEELARAAGGLTHRERHQYEVVHA